LITPVVARLYWRRPAALGRLRSALVLATTAANVVFWEWPVAPLRLAVPGMTDILVTHDILSAADPHGAASPVNLYEAMPSLHVAWCATAIVNYYPQPVAAPGLSRRWEFTSADGLR
jgi:hypothetical protein